MTDPLVPADVDLRDFAYMPLDVVRLRDSDLAATPDAEVFRAAVLSWCVAWHQIPAGSLPDDDAMLARLLGYGRDVKGWLRLREAGALRGWIKCSDGRLYHKVVAEKASEAWQKKYAQRNRTEAARKARELQRLRQTEEISVTDTVVSITNQSKGREGKGIEGRSKDSAPAGAVSSPPENPGAAGPAALHLEPDENKPKINGIPACPIGEIIAEYHRTLPQCPKLVVRNAQRDGFITARWRQVFADGKAKDRADGIEFFREYFAHVRKSEFLTGRGKAKNGSRPFVADLEWLMRPNNFAKVVEGRYNDA